MFFLLIFIQMAFSIDKFEFRTYSLFEGLSSQEVKWLKKDMKRLEIKKNKVVFKEGEYSKGIYVLKKGKVKIYQMNKEGKEQVVYIYGKNEIMGYRPLLCNETHPVTAATIEDSSILFIPNTSFIEVLDRSLKLSRRIHEHLAHEFNVWINTVTVLAQQPAKERLAIVLLILNEKYRKNEIEKRPVINLSRFDMASYTRITIETLARTLSTFREKGIISTEGRKIMVNKPEVLEEIVELY